MTREDFLKNEILKKYKSLRQFALDVGVAPSTITTILNSGIGGTSIDTMFNICDKLDIKISKFHPNNNNSTYDIGLNDAGIQKVNAYIEDLKNNPYYSNKNQSDNLVAEDKSNKYKSSIETKKRELFSEPRSSVIAAYGSGVTSVNNDDDSSEE